MAKSTHSQHRAQLIREMSKDMNRTRNSSGSSQHSKGAASPERSISDFDPENEAMMSTRQLDSNQQRLPELRASAQKYRRFTRPEPDYAINTSAIGRAFPDFSQGSTSSDDGSMSIEIGRGIRKGSNNTIGKLGGAKEYSSNAQLSLDGDSLDFAAPMIGDYEVTGTPPRTRREPSKKHNEATRDSLRRDGQARRASGLRKEIIEPSPPPAKTRDYSSGESAKRDDENRRTLAAMHARVRDENEKSHIGDERPPTIDFTVRNTRFGNMKSQQSSVDEVAFPTRFSSTQGLMNASHQNGKQKQHPVSTSNQGTQQSFVLPDLPNISELVSGVYEDGTPVFSRHGKSRASRFASTLQRGNGKSGNIADVHEIPVPENEQAIFLSLKLLQDKVAVLERSHAEAENTIQDLQQKNRALELEKTQRRRTSQRSDSALGLTDSDGVDDLGGGQRKMTIERNRLEASVRALQTQVDASNRKASTAETILKSITEERDSAVSQLGVAYFTIEQLKDENEGLKEENNALKSRFGQLAHEREDEAHKWTAKEGALRRKLGRRTEAVKAMMEEGPQDTGVPESHLHDQAGPSRQQIDHGKASTHKNVGTMFDLRPREEITKEISRSNGQHVHIDDLQDSEDSECEPSKAHEKGKSSAKAASSRRSAPNQREDPSQDLTYLSFLDNDEVAKLRKTLEQERIERKQKQALKRQSSGPDATISQRPQVEKQQWRPEGTLPHRSSMKDLTSRSVNQAEQEEPVLRANGKSEHNRRHSENSILSTRSRRRGVNAENMTSAFIVPDITIRVSAAETKQVPDLSKENQEILEGLAKHSSQNCTVCKRTIGHDEHHVHDHGDTAKESITIAKPVPVSQRMPKAGPYEDEPTIRPAHAPGLALATVMKGLEDEIAHLKIQLAKYQALYNGHDPALSKRKRKSVYQKMKALLQAIDVKADQIYALYDVLEGQKQAGHEISDEEVEITLQSIGVDVAGLHLRGGGGEEALAGGDKAAERHPWDLSSDDESNDGLPWEGIESTVETTKSGFARASRRRGSTT